MSFISNDCCLQRSQNAIWCTGHDFNSLSRKMRKSKNSNFIIICHSMDISLILMYSFLILLLLLIPRIQLNAHVSTRSHNQQHPKGSSIFITAATACSHLPCEYTDSMFFPRPSMFPSLFPHFWSISFTWVRVDSTFIKKTDFILVCRWKAQSPQIVKFNPVWIYWETTRRLFPWNKRAVSFVQLLLMWLLCRECEMWALFF